MKKIIFLIAFVFIGLSVFSQTQTIPNNLQVNNSINVDSTTTTKDLIVDSTATAMFLTIDSTITTKDLTVDSTITTAYLTVDSAAVLPDSTSIGGKGISEYILENSKESIYESSTGLISGGVISINGVDNTLIDLTALKGKIIDSTTDPDNSTDTTITKDAAVGYNLTTTATPGDVVAIFLSIDVNGDIVERTVLPTAIERRNTIDLGLVARDDADEIFLVINTPTNIIHNPNSSLQDFFENFGNFSIEGNEINAYATDLRIEKQVGSVFRNGVNFRNEPKNPHIITSPLQSPVTFGYKLSDGTDVDVAATQIDPNYYDDGSSTPAAVGSGKVTIQRISMFAEGHIEVLYGQQVFNLMSEAKSALPTIRFTVPEDSKSAMVLAYLIVKQGATDLTVETDVDFFQVRKKGEIGGIGFQNLNSAGMVFDPGYTDPEDGTVSINDGIVNLYQTTDFSGDLKQYNLSGIGPVALTNNNTNYIVADYNSGTPLFRNTLDVLEINESDIVPVYTIYRDDDSLHILSWGTVGTGLVNKLHARLVKTQRFGHESGLALGETGSRYITTTNGIIWMGGSKTLLPATNSSTDATEFWYHVSGAWTKTDTNQYNNTQYDDGTDLQTIPIEEPYVVNWIYQGIGDKPHLYYVLGIDSYVEADAMLSQPPTDLPKAISSHALLVGRIIVYKDAVTATQIASAFLKIFISLPVQNHNQLSNIQGGQSDEYYHHTDDEYNTNHPYLNTENIFTENQTISGDTLLITDGTLADSVMIFDDGDTTRIQSDNIVEFNGSVVVKDILKIGGSFVIGDSTVKAITGGDTLATKEYVDVHIGSFCRFAIFDILTADTWITIKYDSLMADVTTSGFEFNVDSTGIVCNFDGIIQFSGRIIVFNNGTGTSISVYTRVLKNSTESCKFNAAKERTFAVDDSDVLITSTANMTVQATDTIYVQIKVSDTDLDIKSPDGGIFDDAVPFSVNLTQIVAKKD